MRPILIALLVMACGGMPPKPARPVGCYGDMTARCVCDAKGQNCTWVWECSGER